MRKFPLRLDFLAFILRLGMFRAGAKQRSAGIALVNDIIHSQTPFAGCESMMSPFSLGAKLISIQNSPNFPFLHRKKFPMSYSKGALI